MIFYGYFLFFIYIPEEIPVVNFEIVHRDDAKIRGRLNATPVPIHGDLVVCIRQGVDFLEPKGASYTRAIVIRKNQNISKEFEASLPKGEWRWEQSSWRVGSAYTIDGTRLYIWYPTDKDDHIWVKVRKEDVWVYTRLSDIPVIRDRYANKVRELPVDDTEDQYYYWEWIVTGEGFRVYSLINLISRQNFRSSVVFTYAY